MARTIYSYKNGTAEIVSQKGVETEHEFEYLCEEHGVFTKTFKTSKAKMTVKCPKCKKECLRNMGRTNIDQTMYRRDPSSPFFWERGKSQAEIANALMDGGNPY